MVVAIGVVMIGATSYAGVIAYITVLFTDADLKKATHTMYADCLLHFLGYFQIPPAFRDQVRSYYEYLWHAQRGLDTSNVLKLLPPTLKHQMMSHLILPTLSACDPFINCDRQCLQHLASLIQLEHFADHVDIIIEGEVSQFVYIIKRGQVQASSMTMHHLLGPQDLFGANAALEDRASTWTMTTQSECEIFTIAVEDFRTTFWLWPKSDNAFREALRRQEEEKSTL